MRLGAGALVVPDYVGSNSYRVLPLPSVDIAYRDFVTASVQNGIAVSVVREAGCIRSI